MIARTLIAAIAGLLLGAVLAGLMVFGPVFPGAIANGPWRTNVLIGSSEADPVTRAIVARRGLLALNRSETVYFTAMTDSAGDRLREACTYTVTGSDLPTRWWSLTVYAGDDFLARNADDAHALSETQLGSDDWAATVGPAGEGADGDAGHWLSTAGAGDFSLTLRLYHPDPVVLDAPATLDLPVIERQHCGGAA